MTPVDMRDPAFRHNPYPLLLTRYPQLQWVDEAP